MSLSVRTIVLSNFPPLAWIIRTDGKRVDVLTGAKVRQFDHGFFEGGWSGTDSPFELKESGVFFGSGAAWSDGKLKFVGPSHSMESIWIAETPTAVWAANSLPLLIAATRPPDFHILRSRAAIRSINAGLSVYNRDIHKAPGIRIRRFANAIVAIDIDLTAIERQQKQDGPFNDYTSYVAYLKRVIAETMARFGAAEASVYLSRGYDSPAVAALVHDLAPTIALTSRYTDRGELDDGSEVAAALGIDVHWLRERRRKQTTIMVGGVPTTRSTVKPEEVERVAEFYSGIKVSDEYLLVPDRLVAGRAVLSGWLGGEVWQIDEPVWQDFRQSFMSIGGGSGLTEFRLRTGFVHIPVPAIAFNHADILRSIALSDELAPWRLETTTYDRPIARRIAEEAGVPREAFGQKKMFSSSQIRNLAEIAPRMFQIQMERYAPALNEWYVTADHERV